MGSFTGNPPGEAEGQDSRGRDKMNSLLPVGIREDRSVWSIRMPSKPTKSENKNVVLSLGKRLRQERVCFGSLRCDQNKAIYKLGVVVHVYKPDIGEAGVSRFLGLPEPTW